MKHKIRIFEPLVSVVLTCSSIKSWEKEIKDSLKVLDIYESTSKPVDQSIPGQLKSPPNNSTALANLCLI